MHHKLIYGASLYNIKKICGNVPITSPFQIYKGPDRDSDEIGEYVGFECARINGLFTDFTYTYGKTLSLCDYTIPKRIIDAFNTAYPGVYATTYALIQNVYCAKFVNGYIATGYWIFCDEETKDELNERYNEGFTGALSKLDILEVMHNMAKNTPSGLFIGKTVTHIKNCEDCEPWCFNKLANKLCTSYEAAELPSRDRILTELHNLNILSSSPDKVHASIVISDIPMTCVIETRCYCCT